MELENSTFELVNNSYEIPDFKELVTGNTSLIIIYSVLLYIGVCTNIWMLWSLYKSWEKGRRAHLYLLTICIADILGLCIRCSISIGYLVTYYWKGGYYGCKIFMALYFAGVYFAHFVLAGFNVDNAITIICSRSVKAMRIVVLLCAAVMTVFVCVAEGFVFGAESYGEFGLTNIICSYTHGLSSFYWIIDVIELKVVAFWFPLLGILFFGGPALCVWCGKKESISYQKMSQEEDSHPEMKNIGKDIGLVTGYNILFIICWTPAGLLRFVNYQMSLYYIADFISIANSCLNPVVYAIFNCITKRRGNVSPGL